MRDDERMGKVDELDGRIDVALRNYVQPRKVTEPRIAFAQVMERARAERPSHSVRWWTWGMAAAAACLMAVMAAIWMTRVPHGPEIARMPKAPGVVAVPKHPAPAAGSGVQVVAHRRLKRAEPSDTRRAVAQRTPPLPKLAVFPTPRPLSPQEQALIAFAKHGPPAVQRAVLEDQKHWDDPVIAANVQALPPQSGNQQDQ